MSAGGDTSAQVRVILAPALVNLFPGATARVDVQAASVGEMIAALDCRWPGMADRLRDSYPSVRRHINIFVDGRRADLATELTPGCEVYVLTAISGG